MILANPFALFEMWTRASCTVAAVNLYTLADAFAAGAAPEGVWPDITRQLDREASENARDRSR